MRVLGIETSCDETAAAIVEDDRVIRSNIVRSQLDEHSPYGGVVPEIAARAHLGRLPRIIEAALAEAGCAAGDLDAVAATAGPGLIGGVAVGLNMAKAFAWGLGLPFVAINHLEGHALTARLTDEVAFPYLLLLVSGGHTQLLACLDVGRYRRLGTTVDDAVGEAFDKTARLLGLGYPGGPAVEALAADGDPTACKLPRPLMGREGCDFSFSGLKTAVRRAVDAVPGDRLPHSDAADICAGFQTAVGDVLVDRSRRACARFIGEFGRPTALVVAGGVAANGHLRDRLRHLAESENLPFVAPPQNLCADNAAMIAWAGIEQLRRGRTSPLDWPARARWPLDPGAEPALGGGRAGPKV